MARTRHSDDVISPEDAGKVVARLLQYFISAKSSSEAESNEVDSAVSE